MPETCPRRIVGESARTRLRDFRGELDLWTERGPVSFVPRSFQAMGKLRCVMGEGRRGGEEERYVDEVRRLSVGYKLVGLYTDWRVYNHRQQCVSWSLVFFRRINGLFHIGGRRGRVEKLAGRCQKKFFTRARRHNALSSFQSY